MYSYVQERPAACTFCGLTNNPQRVQIPKREGGFIIECQWKCSRCANLYMQGPLDPDEAN